MPLILGVTPNCNWPAVEPLLEAAGWQPPTNNDPETWYQTGLELPDDQKHYLLIHSRPEEAVAIAMAEGKQPEQALQAWLIAAQAMVSFYKLHRKQSVMVNLAALAEHPQPLLGAMANHLDLQISHESELPEADAKPLPALELLMANQLVRQTPNIGRVLAQLEACTLPVDGHDYTAPPVDLGAVITLLTDTKRAREQLEEEVRRQTTTREKAEDESQLLLEQLHQVQEELERQFLQNRELLAKNRELTEQSAQQEAHTQKLTAELEKVKKNQKAEQVERTAEKTEKNRLAENFKKTEERLTQAQKANKTLETKLTILKQQSAQQQDQLKNQEQHNTQLSGELKNLQQQSDQQREQLKRLQQTGEENELLLDQLHLVQEELETQFLARQDMGNKLGDYRQQQDYALEAANREITRLQRELNDFKSSAAWKATAPVRALKKPFRRTSPEKKALKRQKALIKQSGLFDEGWYLQVYTDVAENNMDPIEHYLKFGAAEGRNPSPEFDTDWYLSSYPDVAEAEMNPLVHYIKFGKEEMRAPNRHYHPSLPAPSSSQ